MQTPVCVCACVYMDAWQPVCKCMCTSAWQPLRWVYLSCYQVEEMDNRGHWLPNQDLLWQCGQIFLAEVAIDVAKHAVVGKFNEIRPGVYREFMKVTLSLCLSVEQ